MCAHTHTHTQQADTLGTANTLREGNEEPMTKNPSMDNMQHTHTHTHTAFDHVSAGLVMLGGNVHAVVD